jgi:hypothetical protein
MLLLVPWMAPEEQKADASWAARVAAASACKNCTRQAVVLHDLSVIACLLLHHLKGSLLLKDWSAGSPQQQI